MSLSPRHRLALALWGPALALLALDWAVPYLRDYERPQFWAAALAGLLLYLAFPWAMAKFRASSRSEDRSRQV